MLQARSFTDRQARFLIDNVVDFAVIGLDLAGNITSWNTGATKILGWSSEEVLGRSIDLLSTREDLAAGVPAADMRTAQRTGRAMDERWHLKKDGGRVWTNGELMPMRADSGELDGYTKIVRNRTFDHVSSSALAESEQRYRSLQDAMDEGFCLIEVQCDDASLPIDYRFLEVNSAFERQTGLRDATGG